MRKLESAVLYGAAAGMLAGIPQVLVTQAQVRVLGLPDGHADIGPRFVQRVAEDLGESPSRPLRWTMAGHSISATRPAGTR